MDAREYPGIRADLPQLTRELRTMFENADYEVQVRHEDLAVVLQARKASQVRDVTGTSYALTVKLSVDDRGTNVAMGKQKWLDKVIVGGVVGIFTGGAGFALGAWGAYKQYQITEESWKVVENHMAWKSSDSFDVPAVCRVCGYHSQSGRFCGKCGAPLA